MKNKLDEALYQMNEKELLIILIKAHADTLRRLQYIESYCDKTFNHLLPNEKPYYNNAEKLGETYIKTIKLASDIQSFFNDDTSKEEINTALSYLSELKD
ncbi:MAG: hypothetical protein JST70_12560 [Bacteroidetes bacterium]|nr:hypothetical protein [Bacteroidota bacterium]